jgi:hypothetical protein
MQTVTDAVDLSQKLATSPEVRACFAKQWMRFALDRWDTPADAASIDQALAGFQGAGFKIPDLMVAVATSRTMRFRTPGTGETLP